MSISLSISLLYALIFLLAFLFVVENYFGLSIYNVYLWLFDWDISSAVYNYLSLLFYLLFIV